MLYLNFKKIPISPGVYFFLGKNGVILYIGKATSLKIRLRSYFDSRPKDSRISKMLELAENVRWQETGSEIEALILESQLIKKNRPRFNVMLRDDKQYFYITFTKDSFPKIFITHQIENSIGPFTDGIALRTTLKLLRRIFPYCTCKQKHNNYCLNYHIGKCSGFCCLKNQNFKLKSGYLKNIKAIKEILSGKKDSVVRRFEKEMNTLAQTGNFEKAIDLRDKIQKLKQVFENAKLIKNPFFDSMINQRISNSNILKSLQKVLKLQAPPQRIEGYDIANIQGQFATGAMVVFTNRPLHTVQPLGFRPNKEQYRKFKIKISNQPNDTKMLKEVLTRRFKHKEWTYPDLIIVDGGKGQLSAAMTAISNDKFQMINKIPIIALTKNESHQGNHIYTSIQKTAISLKNLPAEIKNLILWIDAEAHRFAINYYRKLHKKHSF